MRWRFITTLAIFTGCASTNIPTGTYEIQWPRPSQGGGLVTIGTLVVSPDPIDRTKFHPEIWVYGNNFGADEIQTTCLVVRTGAGTDHSFTSLALSKPQNDSSSWTIPMHENHHFRSWLTLEKRAGQIYAKVESDGYMGSESTEVSIERVGDVDIQHCLDAEPEILSELGSDAT